MELTMSELYVLRDYWENQITCLLSLNKQYPDCNWDSALARAQEKLDHWNIVIGGV